ncbi:MAG: hypothetical protein FJ149_05540 [Euryarchaeota archaeon]|nr:hypothetical protein [Euryarchaeota archaeon]
MKLKVSQISSTSIGILVPKAVADAEQIAIGDEMEVFKSGEAPMTAPIDGGLLIPSTLKHQVIEYLRKRGAVLEVSEIPAAKKRLENGALSVSQQMAAAQYFPKKTDKTEMRRLLEAELVNGRKKHLAELEAEASAIEELLKGA